MSKAIKIPTDIDRAEQAWLQACKVREELKAAFHASAAEAIRLADELKKMRTAADRAGPLATISWPRGQRCEQVVIIRRTASTIWTRPIGSADSSGGVLKWRKSKTRGGGWTEYPASYFATLTLTIDGETQDE